MNSYVVDSWEDDESTSNEIIREKTVMLTQMTYPDIVEVEKIFKKYDTKNQGFIDTKHALAIFKATGQYPSLETEQDIINEANESDTGMIMFPDLITIFKKHWKSKDYAMSELTEAVKLFGSKSDNINKDDYEENDIIDMATLSEALANFGDKLEQKDIELLEKYIFKADIKMEKNIKMQISDFIDTLTSRNEAKKKQSISGKQKMSKKSGAPVKK